MNDKTVFRVVVVVVNVVAVDDNDEESNDILNILSGTRNRGLGNDNRVTQKGTNRIDTGKRGRTMIVRESLQPCIA